MPLFPLEFQPVIVTASLCHIAASARLFVQCMALCNVQGGLPRVLEE